MASHRPLLARSGISKFSYAFTDSTGADIGDLTLRTYPNDPISIRVGHRRYRIDVQRDSERSLANDFRFALLAEQQDGREAATPDAVAHVTAWKKSWRVELGGSESTFVDQSRWSRLSYSLTAARDKPLGSIRETTALLSLKRRFLLDFPQIQDESAKIFLFFLAVNSHYR